MHRHVDPSEAQEVVRLAAERQNAGNDGPTVEGLGEALGLPPEEIERLLAEVRRRRVVSDTPATQPQRTFGDRSAAISAAIVLALVLVVGAGAMAYRAGFGQPTATPAIEIPAVPPVPEIPAAPSPEDATATPGSDVIGMSVESTDENGRTQRVTIRGDEEAAMAKAKEGLDRAREAVKSLSPEERAQAEKGIQEAQAELAKKFSQTR